MSKIYCQNKLCEHCKFGKSAYKNYGVCNIKQVFMTWQPDDEYVVTGHNCECRYSQQVRYYERYYDESEE